MAFNYLQPFNPGQPGGNPWAAYGQAVPPAPPGGGVDGNPPQPLPQPQPGGGLEGTGQPGGLDRPMAMPGTPEPAAGYTPEQFGTWYSGAHGGQAPGQDLINQIGGAVGAPAGPNGTYTAAQYQQAQQMAQNPNGQPAPFFSEFQAPKYEAGPAYQAPEAFKAPTMDQALADPGYQFAVQQGTKRLEGSAAARGIARTGGALKNLIDYGQQAATQQYDKVYGRAASEYAQNYQMGRDAWGANQQQRDAAFDRNYKGASDAFNSKFRGQELSFEDLFRRWNTGVNTQTQLALAD